MYCFGVDIGGTTIKMGMFNLEGDLIEKWDIPTNLDSEGQHILSEIADEIKNRMNKHHLGHDEIVGIGVGVPGPVQSNGVVLKCVNIGWAIVNIKEELEALTGLTVVPGNDANVAALGELFKGGGSGCHSMVMVTLGTGVGGGIIIDGKIVSGANGSGGEIGHFPMVDDEEETCGCGNKGCLEQYASATGIVRLAKQLLMKGEGCDEAREEACERAHEKACDKAHAKACDEAHAKACDEAHAKACDEAHAKASSSLLNNEPLTAEAVINAAKAGDVIGQSVIERVGWMLGRAMATLACAINPEVFVIGGGVSKAGDLLIDPIKRNFDAMAFHGTKHTQFVVATLGNDAGIYGGAKLVLDAWKEGV